MDILDGDWKIKTGEPYCSYLSPAIAIITDSVSKQARFHREEAVATWSTGEGLTIDPMNGKTRYPGIKDGDNAASGRKHPGTLVKAGQLHLVLDFYLISDRPMSAMKQW